MRNLLWFTLLAGTALGQDVSATYPTNEQLRHYKSMQDPRLSPSGKQVLLRVSDATADGAKSHVWLLEVQGGEPRQLTYSPEGDKRGERSGEWMPDGKSVLFLAHRGEHTSLYRLPLDGGEAKAFELKVVPTVDESKLAKALPPKEADAKKDTVEKADPVELDVDEFRVSPDGKTVAFTADDPQTPGEKKQKDAKADAEWVDHGLHGARLYLLDVATGKVTTAGVPVDVHAASWSRDSAKLIVVREEPQGASDLGPANSAWVVTVNDAAHPVRLDGTPATVDNAAWSSNGKELYYVAQAKRDTPPGYSDLYVYALDSKVSKNLTDDVAGTLAGMEPLELEEGGVLQIVEEGLGTRLAKVGKDRRMNRVALPLATVWDAVTNEAQSGWVFVGSRAGAAAELVYEAKLGDAPTTLKVPGLQPEHVKTAVAKRVSWKSDRFTIDGLLYLPPEAATKRVPLIVNVHGGPLGAFTERPSQFIDFLVGQGWAVLEPNPRGSTGRGAEFAAANKNDLGGGDYRDVTAGVDFVLKTESIDPQKTALIGYSYGGEMAGFAEVKTTRFKAIVSMAPVIDQNSEYGTESESWYDQWYFGKPWEHEADAWRQSPLSGAAKARTPFMLLQGEGDTTDPLGQAQEMYRALRQMNVPVQLVTYPRMDHGPLANAIFGGPSNEPWHGFDARRRMVEFLQEAFGR